MIDFLNLPKNSLTEFSAAIIILNIAVTFVLAMVISWVYQKTHRSVSYSKSLLMAMVMMSVLATIAMMILSNNLISALGVLGIFALIRFRTIIKDTKDVAYLFFALAAGMAVGTNNYVIAVIGTVMLSLIILILTKYEFGSATKGGFLLVLAADKSFNFEPSKIILEKYAASHQFLQVKAQPNGDQEYYPSLQLKQDTSLSELVGRFKAMEGVKTVELMSGKHAVEY
jgi:uncharacterized membrane protein YhiD involved in acid resistance